MLSVSWCLSFLILKMLLFGAFSALSNEWTPNFPERVLWTGYDSSREKKISTRDAICRFTFLISHNFTALRLS